MNNEQDLVSAIKSEFRQVDGDIAIRNDYMNERDRKIYDNGLFEGLEFPDGSDKTLFNYLPRVVDIHTSQLMGRGFQIYSNYNKDNTESLPIEQPQEPETPEGQEPQDQEKLEQLADLKNKQKQLNADLRKKLIDAIIRDNGGMKLFKHGARIGSAYGDTVYKMWLDKPNKKIKISLLETPQNYYAGWSSSEFRERDWDGYVYQISETQAYKLYGDKLQKGDMFATTIDGNPLGDGNTDDPLNTVHGSNYRQDTTTKRKMVSVIEFTGRVAGWGVEKGEVVAVDKGKEAPFNVLIVGNHVVQTITDEDLIPRYYLIHNLEEPRRAFGASDINEAAIEINRTLIEVMSTWITLFHKEVAPTYLAKGFEGVRIPQRKRKSTTFIPMSLEQTIESLNQPGSFTGESNAVITELKEAFVRVTGVGRVLFDDPTINPSSNQALMTTLKGVIDIVEDKQSRWEPAMVEMFTEALKLSAKIVPDLKDAIEEEGWFLYLEWPSVLRREDNAYQQMWLNLFNSGVISLETYMEKLGFTDTTEEVDRIRDEMKDPTTAAVLSRQLGVLANKVLAPPQPQGPDVKVSLKGQLTPNQEANIADQQGFLDGKFPPTAGPQGNEGAAATDNVNNLGYIQGDQNKAGFAQQIGPDGQPVQDQPLPTLTPDQNTGQTASMPGSGAPAVGSEGMNNMINQQNGA